MREAAELAPQWVRRRATQQQHHHIDERVRLLEVVDQRVLTETTLPQLGRTVERSVKEQIAIWVSPEEGVLMPLFPAGHP